MGPFAAILGDKSVVSWGRALELEGWAKVCHCLRAVRHIS